VRAMSALTMKIPEPIIEPIMIAEESTSVRLFLNVGWLPCGINVISYQLSVIG